MRFGIAVPSDDETTEFSVEGVARNGRTPFRHSLAVTLYGDSLSGRTPLSLQAEEAFTSLLRKVIESWGKLRRREPSKSQVAGVISKQSPTSNRNASRPHLGIPRPIASQFVALLRRGQSGPRSTNR
jgi:hypothetical protein